MKGIYFFIHILTFLTMVGCLPDSLTNLNEEPPSDPYPKATTCENIPGIVYDKNGPFKLQRFIPSQNDQIGSNEESEDDNTSFNIKLYPTNDTKSFSEASAVSFSEPVSSGGETLPTGLVFNTKTGEITGKPTSFLAETTFTVSGTDACGNSIGTIEFNMSVTTKIDSLEYKQKSGKKLLLELSSIRKIDEVYYLYNSSGLFSSYHPIDPMDNNYKKIVTQNGYTADITGDPNDTYNTIMVTVDDDSLFKEGDSIDVGSNYYGQKNTIKKVIYYFDSTIDLLPTFDPSKDTSEAVTFSVSPPIGGDKFNAHFNSSTGEITSDSMTDDFLPTHFNLTVRNQIGETKSSAIWIAHLLNSSPQPLDKLNYKISKNDVFKILLEDPSNFSIGDFVTTSKSGTKAEIISKKNDIFQFKVIEATTDSSFHDGTEVDVSDNSSDSYVWPETKIVSSQRVFKINKPLSIEPDNTTDLRDFEISPYPLPSDLTWDATTGKISALNTDGPTSILSEQVFIIKAKNILGKEVSTNLTMSIINPPFGLSYSRDVILILSETDASIDKKDHIVSSGGAKGIVKAKIVNSPSKPFLLVKVLGGEFKKDEQIDTSYNFNKPVANISSVEYYNASFKLDSGLESTFDGKLILNGTNEETADHIAEIVHIDPTADKAGVYVRIVKGFFTENDSYTINDATNTSIKIVDLTSDNIVIGIPSASQSSWFPGTYVTTGTTSDASYDSSGIVNYVSYENDSSISVNILNGDISADQVIINRITFENTADASIISSIQTDHIYNAYTGEPFRLAPGLSTGKNTTLTYSISPDLPSGLSMNLSTGVIEGTPSNGIDKTNFVVTAYNDSGDTSHDFSLKVHEQFKLALNISNSSQSDAIIHKEGQGHNRTDCRVTLDQMNNDTSTDTKDILCYIEIGENDLFKNGLSIKAETSGICPFVEHLPFGFFKKKYIQSETSDASVFQASGDYTDEICKNQWNGGEDIPEFSQKDGTTDSADPYGEKFTAYTDLCSGDCDDGQVAVTPVHYQKSGTKTCFKDINKDGFFNYGVDDITSDVTEASCDASADANWNYTCSTHVGDTTPKNCTGQKMLCMSGPITKLTGITSEDINDRLGEIQTTNSTLTFNYEAPDTINDTEDITSDLNIYLANFTKKNQCKKSLSNGLTSSYLYDRDNWDNIARSNLAKSSTSGKFHESNPFYTYNCLHNTGEIKARIRLVVRDWNRPFKADSSIDLIDPDSSLVDNNMDASFDSNFPNSYIGTTWNQFSDFDDASSGYNGAPATQCTEADAMRKYQF